MHFGVADDPQVALIQEILHAILRTSSSLPPRLPRKQMHGRQSMGHWNPLLHRIHFVKLLGFSAMQSCKKWSTAIRAPQRTPCGSTSSVWEAS
eukprot:6255365-Amphidinium_carterae.1